VYADDPAHQRGNISTDDVEATALSATFAWLGQRIGTFFAVGLIPPALLVARRAPELAQKCWTVNLIGGRPLRQIVFGIRSGSPREIITSAANVVTPNT
jgi:hypothetical protein